MPGLVSRLFVRQRLRYLLAIDIGSNTAIRSLLFDELDRDRRVLAHDSFELPARGREADLVPLISRYLHRLLLAYVRRIERVPDAVLLGLGSHFTFNETARARKDRERPADPIRLPELQAVLREFLRQHRERTIGARRYALAHLMPFRIWVDGYPIEAISRATRGRTIEIVTFATYALDGYWQSLLELRSILGGIEMSAISDQAAIAAALIAERGVDEALVVKIGAKITEVSMLGQGAILTTGQFPLGGDAVTSSIAERLGLAKRDAERIKRQWGTAVLPEPARAAVGRAIQAAAEQWFLEFMRFLHADGRTVLPGRIYLLGGGSRLAAIGEVLASQPWHRALGFHEAVDVRRLDAQDLAPNLLRTSRPALTGPEEVALAAIAYRLAQR